MKTAFVQWSAQGPEMSHHHLLVSTAVVYFHREDQSSLLKTVQGWFKKWKEDTSLKALVLGLRSVEWSSD